MEFAEKNYPKMKIFRFWFPLKRVVFREHIEREAGTYNIVFDSSGV